MPRQKYLQLDVFEADAFLRSINLCLDAQEPGRIAHYRPTAKSVPLIKGLLGNSPERTFLVIAPYGSGKSITLTYLLNIVENRVDSKVMLASVEKRLEALSPSLKLSLLKRRRSKRRGIVLPLHGYQGSLPRAIQQSVQEAISRNKLGREARRIKRPDITTIEDAIGLLQELKEVAWRAKLDQICIFWDETGRHLEALVSEGRASELSDIQLLAEYVSRSTDLPMTFGLSLHQSILHYAQQMSQSVRTEWQKISGRFEAIQYVDDSKEIYRLIADIVQSNRGRVNVPSKSRLRTFAKQAKEVHGFFTEFSLAELTELFAATYPSHPAAIFLLPRISARVAQNERTLFTFLYGSPLSDGFTISHLYDYFAPSMRGDTAVGGTHKQWLETESAISKISRDDVEALALKGACLLSMGTKGERSRVGRDTLVWALTGYGTSSPWSKTVSRLVDRKLLLYRRHSQEVAVWHGTDIDLRGRLLEEKDQHRAMFDLLSFLNGEAQPEAWKPIRYNTQYGVTRYWPGRYVLSQDFSKLKDLSREHFISIGQDGIILYLVAQTNEDLSNAKTIAQTLADPQIIIVVPDNPLHIAEAALEVWCLSKMQHNSELTGEDPLVLPEIRQMLDDARSHLQGLLDKLVMPNHSGPLWYRQGRKLAISSASELRQQLSHITQKIFPSTPKIHNELVNRHKPSGTIVNSRKKLLMGLLERHGSSDLGLVPTTPDASMFRTILVHTGLYRPSPDGGWQYSSGKTSSLASDPGLKEVWYLLRTFFTEPAEAPKRPQTLIENLSSPPFGIRQGLLPILFTAGLKAFGRATALRYKGEYIADILPTIIEDLCRNPRDYELYVVKLDKKTERYLGDVRETFLGGQRFDLDTDEIRATYDAIQSWLFQLPKAAMTTRSISPKAKRFRRILTNSKSSDPLHLLMREIPELCSSSQNQNGHIRIILEQLKLELEQVSGAYVRKAIDSIHQALARAHSDRSAGVQRVASRWASYFPDAVTATGLPGIARSLLTRMRTSYKNETLFVNALALLVVGRSTEDWDDSIAIEFEDKIQELTHKIETTALRTSDSISIEDAQEIRDGLSYLVAERIEDLYSQLVKLLGTEASGKIISGIVKGRNNGHPK